MRYFLSKNNAHVSSRLATQLKRENGLGEPETYQELKRNIQVKRAALGDTIDRLRRNDKRIVGYGATSKSTTVTV